MRDYTPLDDLLTSTMTKIKTLKARMKKPMAEITYVLIANVDGLDIYKGEFPDTSLVQESGLRKAEHAVDQYLTGLEEDYEQKA